MGPGSAAMRGNTHREFGFTNQQGVWLTTGPNEITAKAMDFNYSPINGDPTAVSRVGFVMQLNPDSQEVRGEMFGERYHLDQNPLNTEEDPRRHVREHVHRPADQDRGIEREGVSTMGTALQEQPSTIVDHEVSLCSQWDRV